MPYRTPLHVILPMPPTIMIPAAIALHVILPMPPTIMIPAAIALVIVWVLAIRGVLAIMDDLADHKHKRARRRNRSDPKTMTIARVEATADYQAATPEQRAALDRLDPANEIVREDDFGEHAPRSPGTGSATTAATSGPTATSTSKTPPRICGPPAQASRSAGPRTTTREAKPMTRNPTFKIPVRNAGRRLGEAMLHVARLTATETGVHPGVHPDTIDAVLWGADVLGYAEDGIPMTGVEYHSGPNGPYPAIAENVRKCLVANNRARLAYTPDGIREFTAVDEPDLNGFSERTLQRIARLCDAAQGSERGEFLPTDAWTLPTNGEAIPYETISLTKRGITEADRRQTLRAGRRTRLDPSPAVTHDRRRHVEARPRGNAWSHRSTQTIGNPRSKPEARHKPGHGYNPPGKS